MTRREISMETTNMQTAENMPVVSQAEPTTEPKLPTLADVIGVETGKQEQVQTPASEAIPDQEPGWYAKRRAKDRADWEAENNAKMAPVLSQLAQLQEYRLGVEADKLVASGKISDRDMAIDYLRSKEGIPAPTTPAATTPPRDERGRFTTTNTPAPQTEVPNDVQVRANELYAQAKTLQKASGVDVLGVYRSNPAFAEKVNSGEWDMVDVLKAAQSAPEQAMRAPAPVRASNGNGIGSANFMTMSSETFAKVNEELRKGGRINMQTY
jgi:hypothetical protein